MWYRNAYITAGEATVIGFETSDKGVAYAILCDGGTFGVKFSDIFAIEEELLTDSEKRFEESMSSMKASIRDVNDLVRFMYNHTIHGAEEYTEEDARQAVRERDKELLGIELGE